MPRSPRPIGSTRCSTPHRDDPEFGYRYLVEDACAAGEPMAERNAWRICSAHRLWSVFGKKRGKNGKVGPPVHDDLVERDFSAVGPNQLWLSDITEHPTCEGKLYLCAIKDVFSNRIVGYCMDSRMKSRLATTALTNAVARRDQLNPPSSGQGASCKLWAATRWSYRWDESGQPATMRPWRTSLACCRRTCWTVAGGTPGRN